MNTAFILWAMIAGAGLMLAAVRVLVWMHDRGTRANLWLALMSMAFTGIAASNLAMETAATPEALVWAERGAHVYVFITVFALVRFLTHYLGTARAILGWTAIGAQALALVLALVITPASASEPGKSSTWWEAIVVGIGQMSAILLLVFAEDASVRLWRGGDKESRRRLLLTAGSVLSMVAIGWVEGGLIRAGIAMNPLLASLPFVIFLIAAIYELSRDLSASARMADEARRHREELAHVVRVVNLSELSGSIAHELNQPLAIILSNAQAAQRMLAHVPPDLEEVRSILADIVHEDRRAGQVIQRLRALLKRGEAMLVPVSLNEIAKEVLQLAHTNLSSRGVEVSAGLCPDLPLVRGDSVQLQQVLLNLLLNAADAMSGNPPDKRRLHVSTSADESEVMLSVRDEGVGLPADIEGIFQPFYTTKAQGLGMGLAICRSIAAAHGGHLTAEAQGDSGAVFRLRLPLRAGVATA